MSWVDRMVVLSRARTAALAGDHVEAQRLFALIGIVYSTRPPVHS